MGLPINLMPFLFLYGNKISQLLSRQIKVMAAEAKGKQSGCSKKEQDEEQSMWNAMSMWKMDYNISLFIAWILLISNFCAKIYRLYGW